MVSALEDAKYNHKISSVKKDYDQDLRRVRQMQQMQAEQDAKIKAQKEKEKKAELILSQDVNAEKKKKEAKQPVRPKKKYQAAPSLSMNNFSTPSYR